MAAPAWAGYQGPLVDTHIHYSRDAWDNLPPPQAIAALREAGLERAFVSSSSDEGTQKLYTLAPELVVPVLRPYRARGELSSWLHDATVGDMLASLIAKNRYAGIGEFHVSGTNADLPLLKRVVQLAEDNGLFLHAHADADAIERMFAQNPDALILWAHCGFEAIHVVRDTLGKYPNLWADLAFRSEHDEGGQVADDWRQLFQDFPRRFMLGTDTYAPERWYFVSIHANNNRAWLGDLPAELAKRIAYRNAMELVAATRYGKSAVADPCQAAGKGQFVAKNDKVQALVRLKPAEPRVGEHFEAFVQVCDPAGAPLDVAATLDAGMPSHGHGMNYTPVTTQLGGGKAHAKGLMFHMPGEWQVTVNVQTPGGKQRLKYAYEMGF